MSPLDELAIYRAFLRLPSDRLPETPFMLNSWTRINGDRWLEVFKAEVQAAVDHLEGRSEDPHPRQRSGALLTVLHHLKPLIRSRRSAA